MKYTEISLDNGIYVKFWKPDGTLFLMPRGGDAETYTRKGFTTKEPVANMPEADNKTESKKTGNKK